MKAFKYGILLALALVSMPSRAFLLVEIINDTDAVCKLQSYDLLHGILWSAVPQRIAPTLAGSFNADDSGFRGPEVVLNYECGDKKISLNCQEDMGFFSAGDVHARLISADAGIIARAETQNGSYYWNQAGVIRWFIDKR